MDKNAFLTLLMTILKPFKLAHYKLTNNADHAFQDKLASFLSFAAAAAVIVRCFPYDGIGDFIVVIFGSILMAGVCVFAVSFFYPHVVKVLTMILGFPAMIYDLCDDKINNVTRTDTDFRFLHKIPRAEVGIKYFIERDKRIAINHARYVGPN